MQRCSLIEDTVRKERAGLTSVIQHAPLGRIATREPAAMELGKGIFLCQQSSTPAQSLQPLEDGVLNS